MGLEWFISLFNKTMQKLSAKLAEGAPTASLKRGPEAIVSFASPNIHRRHRCRSRQSFGGVKELCPDSSISSKKYFKTSDLQKQLFMSIRAPLFSNQRMLGAILLKFSGSFRRFSKILPRLYGILSGFSPNQNFGGPIAPPAPSPPTPVTTGYALSTKRLQIAEIFFTYWAKSADQNQNVITLSQIISIYKTKNISTGRNNDIGMTLHFCAATTDNTETGIFVFCTLYLWITAFL